MNAQKQKLLERIHTQIKEKRDFLMSQMPNVHRIDDGIVIRFFTDWERCEDNEKIRYVKVESDVEGEIIYKFFLPKGTYLDIKKREYASCVLCLEGHLVLEVDDDLVILTTNTKRCLNNDVFQGRVLKDSYILTKSNTTTS